MECFDNMEAAQEIAALLKSGKKDEAANLIDRMVDDFDGITGFIDDLNGNKDHYAAKTGLLVCQVEWIAGSLSAAWNA